MEKHTHDYKDTIKEATEVGDESEEQALRRAAKADAEAAFEALAVTSSMGMLGMEATTANLLQLELAQELLYKYDEQNNEDGEFHIGD